jgi:predicted RNA binding protein YcfA (HicA-like mRNA interferase family)
MGRQRGSHHIFTRPNIQERTNLQESGGDAKIYQVRQVRKLILKYGLGGMKEGD